MPKLCPNITFPHQQDFFPIRSVTKSSTARFSHENLVEKFKIFVQDFVPIRTALIKRCKISPPDWGMLRRSCARESDCAVRRIITAAKNRLQNLLCKPIILNSGPHSAQTLQQLLLLLLALRQNGTRDAHKISPHGTMTKR